MFRHHSDENGTGPCSEDLLTRVDFEGGPHIGSDGSVKTCWKSNCTRSRTMGVNSSANHRKTILVSEFP